MWMWQGSASGRLVELHTPVVARWMQSGGQGLDPLPTYLFLGKFPAVLAAEYHGTGSFRGMFTISNSQHSSLDQTQNVCIPVQSSPRILSPMQLQLYLHSRATYVNNKQPPPVVGHSEQITHQLTLFGFLKLF